jgi:hypothetical protein
MKYYYHILYILIIYFIIRLVLNILQLSLVNYNTISILLENIDQIFNLYIDKNYLKLSIYDNISNKPLDYNNILSINDYIIKKKDINQFIEYYNNIQINNDIKLLYSDNISIELLQKKAIFTYLLIDYDNLYNKNNNLIKMFFKDNYNNSFYLMTHNSTKLFSSTFENTLNKLKNKLNFSDNINNDISNNIKLLNNLLYKLKDKFKITNYIYYTEIITIFFILFLFILFIFNFIQNIFLRIFIYLILFFIIFILITRDPNIIIIILFITFISLIYYYIFNIYY